MRISARFAAVLATVAFVPLAACSGIKEAVNGPNMTPIGYPAQLVPQNQEIGALAASAREPAPQRASANSLWRTGARAFFNDQRASRVGDILTVQIEIDDSAKTQNGTTTSRTTSNKTGVPHFFGLESTLGKILPSAYDPSNMIETNSATSNAGSGAVNRAEKISLTIAAVVTQVLPNGNLVIQGTQEVKANNDLRELTVAGIVRPEDISSSNTIKHTQIAEARISYGGRGDISAVQKTPAGTAILQRITPF
ncbi:MAG: flagellar basal body L-ring protein FlgH [Proteobacteria bacterium]|nr:flagellar basal body L-ring protein FlgH [Pseudomonadota bacterium]